MTLISNMVDAVDVVTDAQSPLGWAVLAARIISYLSAATVVILVARRFRTASSEARRSMPAVHSVIGLFAVSVLAVLILKASYDAGRSWSQLLDAAVLSDAITSSMGIVALAQLCVALTWLLLGRSTISSRKWRLSAVLSVVVLICAFVADGTGLTTRADDYKKFSITLVEADVVGDFTVAPTRVGSSEVHLYFSPPSGMLSPMQNVSLEFVDIQTQNSVAVPLVVLGPNHWLGIAEFKRSGQYTMTVQALTAQNAPVQYVTNIVINP